MSNNSSSSTKNILYKTYKSTISLLTEHHQAFLGLFLLLVLSSIPSIIYNQAGQNFLSSLMENNTLELIINHNIQNFLKILRIGVLISLIPVIYSLEKKGEPTKLSTILTTMVNHLIPAIALGSVYIPILWLANQTSVLTSLVLGIVFYPVAYLFLINHQPINIALQTSLKWFCKHWKVFLSFGLLAVVVLGASFTFLMFSTSWIMGLNFSGDLQHYQNFDPTFLSTWTSITLFLTTAVGVGIISLVILLGYIVLIIKISDISTSSSIENSSATFTQFESKPVISAFATGICLFIITSAVTYAFPGSFKTDFDEPSNSTKPISHRKLNKMTKLEEKIRRSMKLNDESLPEYHWDIKNYVPPEDRTFPKKHHFLTRFEKVEKLFLQSIDSNKIDTGENTISKLNTLSREFQRNYSRKPEAVKVRLQYYHAKILSVDLEEKDEIVKLYIRGLEFITELPKRVKNKPYTRITVRDFLSNPGDFVHSIASNP